MFPLNFKFFIFLTNEVVSCKCDGSFYAAAFKNESIHSGNCFVHELDPPQIYQNGGKKREYCAV